MQVGDKIIKETGDYTFEGIIVCAFNKLKGAKRFVVEDNRGLLLIMNENQMVLTQSD